MPLGDALGSGMPWGVHFVGLGYGLGKEFARACTLEGAFEFRVLRV
jgi:hypothetical protein